MARFKKLPQKREGKIVYGDGIVEGIVYLAVSELEDVELDCTSSKKGMKKGIKVTFDKDNVHVLVAVKIQYQQSVSDVAFKIQETVRHNVESMTEYHISSVNVYVKGVTFEDKPAALPAAQTNN